MRVAIIKTSAIGDVLQSIPLAILIKKHLPDSHITWVVEAVSAPLLESLPQVDQVIPIDTKVWRKQFWRKSIREEIEIALRKLCQQPFDAVIDIQGNIKSSFFTLCAPAKRKIGFKDPAEWPNKLFTNETYSPKGITKQDAYLESLDILLNQSIAKELPPVQFTLTSEEKIRLEKIMKGHFFKKKVLLVCPGSRWQNKRLSYATLETLLQTVQQHHADLSIGIVTLGEIETEMAKNMQVSSFILSDLTLPMWHYVMKHAKGVITVDSAALHLAMLTPTPIFSLFGPSQASVYHPLRKQDRTIQGHCPYQIEFSTRCPKLRSCPTGACIKDLATLTVGEQLLFWVNHYV